MAEIELAVNKHGYTLIETVNDYITVAFPLILMLMVLVTVVTELDVEVCASAWIVAPVKGIVREGAPATVGVLYSY